ncbi:MAG: hypothetical protein ACE5EK_00435 [Nitrospinales bacterium]
MTTVKVNHRKDFCMENVVAGFLREDTRLWRPCKSGFIGCNITALRLDAQKFPFPGAG